MIKSLLSIHHNDIVMVKLNEAGLNQYENHVIKERAKLPMCERENISLTSSNLDAQGRARFPLWLLMEIFGPIMKHGKMPPWDGEIKMEVDLPDFDC